MKKKEYLEITENIELKIKEGQDLTKISPKQIETNSKMSKKYLLCNKFKIRPFTCLLKTSLIGISGSLAIFIPTVIKANESIRGCYPGESYFTNCKYDKNNCCENKFTSIGNCIETYKFMFYNQENNKYSLYRKQMETYCNKEIDNCDSITKEPNDIDDCNQYLKKECGPYITECRQSSTEPCNEKKYFQTMEKCIDSKYKNCKYTFNENLEAKKYEALSILSGVILGIFFILLFYLVMYLIVINQNKFKKFFRYLLKKDEEEKQ